MDSKLMKTAATLQIKEGRNHRGKGQGDNSYIIIDKQVNPSLHPFLANLGEAK